MTTDIPKSKSAAPVADEVPVRVLRFLRSIDVPGKDGAMALAARTEMNRPSWALHYLPAQRHFRIVYSAPQRPTIKAYVHETVVGCWEPLE